MVLDGQPQDEFHMQATIETPSRTVNEEYGELIARTKWNHFVTLTTADHLHPHGMSAGKWFSSIRQWLRDWQFHSALLAKKAFKSNGAFVGPFVNAYRKKKQRARAIFVLEPHKSGKLHAHGLVKCSPALPWLDYGKARWLWMRSYGLLQVEPPKDQSRTACYLAKYVLKEADVWDGPTNVLFI